jgi:hypothetical protein
MNALRQYIKQAVIDLCSGSKVLNTVGTDLKAAINRTITKSASAWKTGSILSSPRDLKTTIDWEVNDYLNSRQGNLSPLMATKTQSSLTGILKILSINPNRGLLLDNTVVTYENSKIVIIGKKYAYRRQGDQYIITGDENTWVQSAEPLFGPTSFIWGQLGTHVYTVTPGSNNVHTLEKLHNIMLSPNSFVQLFSDGTLATVEDKHYNEYVLAPTKAEPLAVKLTKTVDLSSYFNDDGTRWLHTHPGKMLECNGMTILILMRIKDEPSDIPNGFPIIGTRTYYWQSSASYVAYDLVIINRRTGTLNVLIQPYSTLPLQVSHTGFVDVMIDAVTKQLLVAFIEPVPMEILLTVHDTKLSTILNGTTHTILSRTDFTTYFDFHDWPPDNLTLAPNGSTRDFTFGGHNLKVYSCNVDSKELVLTNIVELFNQVGTFNSQWGSTVGGGFTHAILAQDPVNYDVYLMRGYTAYLQVPLNQAISLVPGLDHSGNIILDTTYDQNLYPGDIIAYTGNRFYNLSYQFPGKTLLPPVFLADLPGDCSSQRSALANDSPGAMALCHTLINSFCIYKAVHAVYDNIAESLRTTDVSGIFEGGTNDGTIFNDTSRNMELSYISGANIYINRHRFGIIRDSSQPKAYQARLLIAGLMLNLPTNAVNCGNMDLMRGAMQGLILITPDRYSNTESNPFGFTIVPGSLFNNLYDDITPDGTHLTIEQVKTLLTNYYRINSKPNPEQYPLVWQFVTRQMLLKLDFVLVTPDQWYLVGDLQVQTGWTGYRWVSGEGGFKVVAPGDVFNIPYAECWQLQPQSIHGWDQTFPVSPVRQNLIVGKINK